MVKGASLNSSVKGKSRPRINVKWRNLFKLIPGYCPIATAAPGQWFDVTAAEDAIAFFHEVLTHTKGKLAGQPLILEPWQQAIVGCIFGWKNTDGTRRYREVFKYIARKNGKTTWAAGIVLYMLFCDGELGAEIYSAAAEREQAALVFQQAKEMVLAEPELACRCQVFRTFKSIEYPAYNNIYKAISADADTKHGFNASCIVNDELHAQRNRDLVDVLMTSTGARDQPLTVHITTADYDRESICNEKYDYARMVRDNGGDPNKPGYDPSFLPVIFEASRDDDWTDPAVWAKANPNLGVSISEDYLARECLRAQNSPAFENTFKRLHLNIRTQQDVRWLKMKKWDACTGEVAPGQLESIPCTAGLDLASTIDIAALVLEFQVDGDPVWLPFFWAPKENARERQEKDKVPYLLWAEQGLIKLTPGNVIDYDVIRADINEIGKRYEITGMAIDRWNSTQLQTQLAGDGFEVVQYGQGYASMSSPTKDLEAIVLSSRLRHGGHPILRWMAGNVAVDMDAAGNLKPSKKKSTEKIDGIVAGIMAHGLAALPATTRECHDYDERGGLAL